MTRQKLSIPKTANDVLRDFRRQRGVSIEAIRRELNLHSNRLSYLLSPTKPQKVSTAMLGRFYFVYGDSDVCRQLRAAMRAEAGLEP